MAKHMKLWVVGALLLAVGGAVVASNMGFKFVPNVQLNKDTTISLPLNNNYADANSVFTDIQGSGCTPVRVQRIVPSAGAKTKQTWSGSGTNFAIAKGEGYLVVTSNNCTTWVIVGSHDPAYVYNIQASKDTLVSIPYHTTATSADDIYQSLLPEVVRVQRIVPSAGAKTKQTWSGSGTNFAVTIGESYLVVTNAAKTWTPAHY